MTLIKMLKNLFKKKSGKASPILIIKKDADDPDAKKKDNSSIKIKKGEIIK